MKVPAFFLGCWATLFAVVGGVPAEQAWQALAAHDQPNECIACCACIYFAKTMFKNDVSSSRIQRRLLYFASCS